MFHHEMPIAKKPLGSRCPMRDDTLIRKMVMFRCGRLPEGSVDRVQMLMPCTEDVPNSYPHHQDKRVAELGGECAGRYE